MARGAVAAVGQNSQRHIQIDVEAHLAGQTIEVEEVDADAERVFHAIASGIAGNQRSCALFDVV